MEAKTQYKRRSVILSPLIYLRGLFDLLIGFYYCDDLERKFLVPRILDILDADSQNGTMDFSYGQEILPFVWTMVISIAFVTPPCKETSSGCESFLEITQPQDVFVYQIWFY